MGADKQREQRWRPRILGWALLLAVLGSSLGCGRSGSGVERVVLVTIDTLRADRLGSYGDLGARTPVLDQLAAQGVRFENAIAPVPLTLPSHTSLMTGQQPPAHGVRHNSVFAVAPDTPLLAESLREAGYTTAAFVAAFVLDARYGLDRGFDVYDDDVGQRRASKSPFSFAERRGDEVVDAALAWLADAPDRFFVWVHLYDPHADYDPPPEYLERAAGDAYAGEIAFADAQVGRLLRAITRRWGPDGLVVAVTSDHGESLGEHQEPTHSYTIYEATQRVPLILAGHGLPAGQVVDATVRLVDVAPTLLWLTGAAALDGAQGRSLARLIHLGPEQEERVAYVETLATQLEMAWSPLLGVRTTRHKYIRAPQPELYDLGEDPGETRNLALVQPELARELDGLLERELQVARPVEASLELGAEDRTRLESLGYVVPGEGTLRGELGVVGGLNPRDLMLDAIRVRDARSALAGGRPERALELLEPVQGGGPHVAQTRAQAALAAGRAEQAVAIMEAAPGDYVTDRTLLGMAYLAAGRLPEARRTLEGAHREDPDAHGPLLALARLAHREADPVAAERWLREAERVAPQPEGPRLELAVLRLDQGRVDEADALLEGIGGHFLTDPPRALRLARAEHAAGRTARALEILRGALRERPAHARLLAAYTEWLESEGRFDEALVARRRAHAQDPDDPAAKNDLAWGLALAGRNLERALALAREAAEALGDDAAVLDTLATVHLLRGEPDAALRAADRALAANPEALRPDLLFLRAAALEALGQEPEARDALRAMQEAGAIAPHWRERAEGLAQRLGVGAARAAPG